MGYEAVDRVLEQASLPHPQKMVLVALAKHVKNKSPVMECWPSIKTLAHIAGMSERNTQRVIKQLTKLGYISILEDGGGFKKSNRYRLHFPSQDNGEALPTTVTACHPLKPLHQSENTDSLSYRGDNLSQTVTTCPNYSDNLSPESVKKSVKESINEVVLKRAGNKQQQAEKQAPPEAWASLKKSF